MASKKMGNTPNPIQEKINKLIEERNSSIDTMNSLQQQYDTLRDRIIEINGALKTLAELFSSEEAVNDTESETKSRSNSNKE